VTKTNLGISNPDSFVGKQCVVSFFIPVPPVPASRPRVTRWGTYYGKTYKEWMKAAALWLEKKEFNVSRDYFTGELFVRLSHVIQKARTSKREWPRGDVDNYAKATLDAITKAEIMWHDDDQVVSLVTSKRYAVLGDVPGTLVEVYR
jgi:Holliday junction resolvase RusA-like endonuclease